MDHDVVGRDEWRKARLDHLQWEKELTRLRDQVSRERRGLPWLEVAKDYRFAGPEGEESLADLFAGLGQLAVYHFMFGPGWGEGCPSCSFWADNFDGIAVHLRHRDTAFAAISRAPFPEIEAYRERMGWTFKWLSSAGTDFNYDLGVSFTPEQAESSERLYNFGTQSFGGEEAPGISIFRRGDRGEIYLTYQTFSRGLDMVNGAYHWLDLTSKGRDETDLEYTMAWLRRHDAYPN